MSELLTIFTLLSVLAIIGFILNLFATRFLTGTGRITRLKVVAVLKGVINLAFVVSWAAFLFGYPVLSIPLFFITGALLVLLSYLLFNIVHDQIFVKRGAEFISVGVIGIALIQTASEIVQQYKDIISNVYAVGLGFMLGINFLTAYYAYQLYQEMRGGAIIWLLIAVYAGSIFFVSGMSVLATFYNVAGLLKDIDSFIVSMSPMILPDLVMISIGYYYKKDVLPLLEKLKEGVKA